MEGYKTPMDWYLGKKPRTSVDDAVEALERVKKYFPSRHYEAQRAERVLGKRLENLFPTDKYLELRKEREDKRTKRRSERNETISAVYNHAFVPSVKAVGRGVGNAAYWAGYGAIGATKLIGKTAKIGAKYAFDKTTEILNNLMELNRLKASGVSREALDRSIEGLLHEVEEIPDDYTKSIALYNILNNRDIGRAVSDYLARMSAASVTSSPAPII